MGECGDAETVGTETASQPIAMTNAPNFVKGAWLPCQVALIQI